MPPLSSCNHFTCLELDTLIEPHICIASSTEVVKTHSHPPIPNWHSRLAAWEHRLPIKYVVAASPGLMSLLVDVEIESTDTAVKWCTQALIDCSATAGHADRFKTLKMVLRNYWWPQISRYISVYVKTCDLCNRTKLQHRWPSGELHLTETPEEQWQVISVNFIVELPESHGYDVIMKVVDSVSKWVHCILTHTTISAKGAALLYYWEVWKHHGLSQWVLSDRGSQFIAGFTRELYKLLDIKLTTSMAYHPQPDGQTEHFNQELEGYLRNSTSQWQDNWDELLPLGEFTYNNHVRACIDATDPLHDRHW
jgi:hypothetical protein